MNKYLIEALELIRNLRRDTKIITVRTDEELQRIEYLIEEVLYLLTHQI